MFKKFNEFYHSLLNEGGSYGRIKHVYENINLSFYELKKILHLLVSNELDAKRKIDGKSLWVTVKNGSPYFSRNISNRKAPQSIDEFQAKYLNHVNPYVSESFIFASNSISAFLRQLDQSTKSDLFNDGMTFMNLEVVSAKSINVIPYSENTIYVHNFIDVDLSGAVVREYENFSPIRHLLNREFDFFKIKANDFLKFDQSVSYIFDEFEFAFDSFLSNNNITPQTTIADYLFGKFRAIFRDKFDGISPKQAEYLINRMVYQDRSKFNLNAIKKQLDTNLYNQIVDYEKSEYNGDYFDAISDLRYLIDTFSIELLKKIDDRDVDFTRLYDILPKSKVATKNPRLLSYFNRIGGISSICGVEGIVFDYKGGKYKLTGSFGVLNAIIGSVKFKK